MAGDAICGKAHRPRAERATPFLRRSKNLLPM